jgi:hypothetical protein
MQVMGHRVIKGFQLMVGNLQLGSPFCNPFFQFGVQETDVIFRMLPLFFDSNSADNYSQQLFLVFTGIVVMLVHEAKRANICSAKTVSNMV